MEIEKLIMSPIIEYAKKILASDIHLSEWKPITFRVNWELIIKEEFWLIWKEKMKKILNELANNDKDILDNFFETKDFDFAYIHSDWTSFRVNSFYRIWNISCVLRLIEKNAKSLYQLWLPEWVKVFTKLKQWLILITWPTGSWKSTTMISILDEINKNRWEHILTIEDPIEFVFKDDKSVFSQREVWRDTKSFEKALRWAMREDPNIIMIWEMRDIETVKAALELAETWHLVISTLHTSSSSQTINRLLSFFPTEAQNWVRDKLADSLKWVLSQRLIPKKDGSWRIWIYELMFMTSWIKNLVRTWTLNQIQANIETWTKQWMITMKKYADILRDKWIIEESSYINYFREDAEQN